ncbi:MAG: MoxR family ATPase, partial [Caldilineaceae bacterium]
FHASRFIGLNTSLPMERTLLPSPIHSIDSLSTALAENEYIADRSLATAIFLALKLQRPLFLEGEAGVGKTEVAKVLSRLLERPLIRLQCYEGLDVSTAVYEWNYTRQMLQIRLMEAAGTAKDHNAVQELFSDEFLLRRPLLQAIDSHNGQPPVLLIDELDRADEEFEAFLLEVLSDFQITVPEIGTIQAVEPPVVIVTSNRTREVHDALKRRCLYHWIDYPSFEKEYGIVLAKVPAAPEQLARQVVAFIQELRQAELYKLPGVAETLDWINALVALDQEELHEEVVNETLGVLLKYRDDIQKVQGESVRQIIDRLRKEYQKET